MSLRSTVHSLRSRIARSFGRPPTESQTGDGRDIAILEEFYGDLSPARVAADLRAYAIGNLSAAMLLFDAMEDRDGRLSANMALRRAVAAGTSSSVTAAAPDDASEADLRLAEEIADDVEKMLWRVWTRPVRINQADAIGKEFSLNEIFWTVHPKSGRVDVEVIDFIEPTALGWADGRIRLRLKNSSDWKGTPLVENRYLRHEHPARPGRAGRRGLLRPCALLVMARNYSIKNWMIFAELFGQPIRIGKYPTSFDAAGIAGLKAALRDMGVSAWATVPTGAEIEIKESSKGGRGSTPNEAIIDWAGEELTITVLGQTLTTSAGDLGSQALGTVHDKVRGDLRQNDAELLCETCRRDLVIPYVAFNYGRPDLAPWIVPQIEEGEDLEKAARIAETLQRMGKRLSVADVSEKFGWREPDEGEAVLEPPAQPPALGFGAFGNQATGFARQAARTAGNVVALRDGGASRDDAANIADEALASAPVDFTSWLQTFVNAPLSFKGLLGVLDPRIAGTQDVAPPADLVDVLSQLMLLGDLAGRESWASRTRSKLVLRGRRTMDRERRLTALRASRGIVRHSRVVALADGPKSQGPISFSFEPLPFDEAIANLRARTSLPRAEFDALVATARKRAFTAAGISSKTALEALKAQVVKAMEDGQTYEEFRAALPEAMAEAGYAGESPTNLNLVFHQNVMSAYAAGQWTQMQSTAESFPYWRYRATGGKSGDGRTRPEHAALDGKVFRIDDASAAAFFPPWDYGCRCDGEPLTQEDVDDEGLTVEGGAQVRKTPITFEQSGQTVTLYARPKPDFDADPLGRLSSGGGAGSNA